MYDTKHNGHSIHQQGGSWLILFCKLLLNCSVSRSLCSIFKVSRFAILNKIHADLLSSKADISKAVSPKLKLSAWLDGINRKICLFWTSNSVWLISSAWLQQALELEDFYTNTKMLSLHWLSVIKVLCEQVSTFHHFYWRWLTRLHIFQPACTKIAPQNNDSHILDQKSQQPT